MVYCTNIKPRWILLTVISIKAPLTQAVHKYLTMALESSPGVKIEKRERGGTLILLSQIAASLLSTFEVNRHPQFIALSEPITAASAVSLLVCDIFFLFLRVNQPLTKYDPRKEDKEPLFEFRGKVAG